MTDTKPTVLDALKTALGHRIDPAAQNFIEMMADDFVMEFPYARPGMPTWVEGRANVLTHLIKVGGDVSVDSISGLIVHETADAEVVILEFDGHGKSVRTGEPYEQRYISVIRARGGKMVHFKDYWNPIQGLKAQLGCAAVDAFILGGAGSARVSGRVLVTGATGKTGRSLVALLKNADVAYRAASRSGETPFDWSAPETWDAALEGVTSVYLVAPAAMDDAPQRMIDFLQLAMSKGPCRFVLLSMASLPAGGPAQGQVHQWLKDNAEDWVVLCPSAFMENFSEGPSLAPIRDEGTFYSNTGEGRVPFISTVDIAQAAFAALTTPTLLKSEFTLTGDESITYDDVADLISQACGRQITHTHISMMEMTQRLRDRGLPERNAFFLAAGYQTIADGAQERTSPDFRTLTGRAPVGFQAFAEANAIAWKRQE